jgi:hypothetical protein
MRIRWKRLALIFGIPLVLAALGPTAYASASTPATGTFNNTITPQKVTSHDGDTVIAFTFLETITGTLSGSRVGSGVLVIHPDGSLNVHNSGTFTGTIAGRGGTASLHAQAWGTFAAVEGRWWITDGAGGLEGIHARGSLAGSATGPTSFAGTYSGEVEFDAHQND